MIPYPSRNVNSFFQKPVHFLTLDIHRPRRCHIEWRAERRGPMEKKTVLKNYGFLAVMLLAMLTGCLFGQLLPKAAEAT